MPHVLIADDDEAIRALLSEFLQTEGFATSEAVNGERVQAALAEGGVDLVLMDVRMPGIDGLEAARRIRAAENKGGPRIPIVALTANAYPEHRDACLAAGMDGFVTKPLDRERLMRALDDISRVSPVAA